MAIERSIDNGDVTVELTYPDAGRQVTAIAIINHDPVRPVWLAVDGPKSQPPTAYPPGRTDIVLPGNRRLNLDTDSYSIRTWYDRLPVVPPVEPPLPPSPPPLPIAPPVPL